MAVQINVAANQAALVASIQAGVQAYNQRFAQNNQLNLQINARAFSQPLGRITGDVKDFEAALAASNARVIAFGASTAVLGGVIRSFKELASVTIEVEKNLADINRVFGLTTSQLQKFSTDLFNVTKLTASSFNDASKAALEFSRQGLKAEETLQRTKDALTLTRLAGISTANAVDALTSTVNGFAATGVTTSQILNKLVAVEQDFAVGAGDLAEALSRTGQAAQEAGVSLDQLNALVTSAQQSTARGGAVIGNALKTIFTRLQRTETLDQLEAFNISVRDVQGNILPAVTILQNFAGAYKNLADAQRAQLSEQVAGVYQVNILKAIVNDLNKSQGVYAGALQRGASATNEAEIATAKLNKTLDALLSQTATSAQQLANNIGKVTFEPLARYGTEQLKSLVESMNEILEGEGIGSTFANGLLKGIRNVIAGPGAIAAFFTLFKLIQNSFSFLTQALPQIAGITTETQNRKNIEQSILQIMQQQGPISQALAGTMGNQAAQAQLLLQLARQQTAEYQQQSALAKQLAAQLAGQGVKVAGARGLQVTRSSGYVPTATKLAEVVGAKAGGYTPGRVVPAPVGGVMNTAEDVKYIPGFAQPFINPPANSKAGRAHRQNAISRTGVDPYMAGGFIPNFAETGSIPVGLMSYPKIKKALRDSKILKSGVEEGDLITVDSFKHFTSKDNVNFQKLPNESATQYENRIIKYWKYNDNSKLASKGSSAIDGYRGNSLMEIKSGGYNFEKTIDKFYRAPVENAHLKINQSWNKFTEGKPDNKHVSAILVSPKFDGFIPNFAPPTSAIRVPWFRKFGNASFDAIQPTLGISRASDTDTFRSSQFRSKAFEKAATDGDPNLFAPLYEDFIFKALQLVSQPKIKDQLIRGYVNQPGTDQKQSAFDAFLGDVGLEFKGFPKGNLTGSISKNLNDKYERYAKANPTGAAKIKESIIAFNEIGDKNQLPSDFGKNFIQLAGTSYSEMAKNNPDLVKGLSTETNILLQRYVKNPAFLAMAASHGFIPNFASLISSSIKGKGNISAIKTGKNNYEIEGVEVGKKFRGQGLGSQLYNSIVQKIGSGNTIKSVLLPQEQALADYASGKNVAAKAIFPQLSWAKTAKNSKLLVNGKEIAISDFENGIASHKYNAAKLDMALIELVNSHASGFIPNFAYKQAVMGLEESMSGNKAIFDTKPFPHIRNSSQPTFSSAIADHGGLANAMSDSMRGQKAAGLMSGGFIPNFADSSINVRSLLPNAPKSWSASIDKAQNALMQLADELLKNKTKVSQYSTELAKVAVNNKVLNSILPQVQKQLMQEINEKKKSIRNQKISSLGTTLAFAGPMAAGLIEQSVFGSRKRTDMSSTERSIQSGLSTGLTSISTGASIGAAFGPLGAGIGAATGALIGLTSALSASTLSAEELKEKKEEEKNKIAENISSAERYLAIQEEISKSTSPKDIRKNLVSLRAEFSSIKDADFANKIKAAGTDINSLSSIVQEYSLKQKEATSSLNDAILVQKKYSFEVLKSAGILKIQKEGGTGALAQTKKLLSGGVNAVAQFFGIGGTKETELGKLDFANKKTRETVYKENPNLFKSLSKIDPNILVDIGNVFAGEVTSTMGFGGFRTGELEDLLKKGGLKGSELDETVAVLKEAGDSSNYLGNTLADAFVSVVAGFSKYNKALKKEEISMTAAAEAVADLNQQLKDFINNLDYSFKDLNRQNDFEKKLRGVRSANTMMISESLYGKRDALVTQKYFDIQDVESEKESKKLDISKKLLTTNIRDYYNLSDAQKTTYLELSKSFDLSKPEKNLEKIENFIKTQFGNLDIGKAADKQKDYLTIISNIRRDIAQTEKESADDLYLAAEKFEQALMAMELSRDFIFQFKAGFRDLATEGEMLIGTIGRQLPKMFADGLVDGIKAAIRESDNLGQALMGIASKFLDEISTMMLRSSIYQIMGSFAPSLVQGFVSSGAIPVPRQKGGIIRAQSGMYISGSGSGDKYPALLENGEYVLNRRAVMAMGGPAALDTLNFSAAPRFASGGSFSNEFTDLKSMEDSMTTYGMENSKLYNELRDAEISAAEERRRKAFARKQQRAALIGSAVAAVASIGLSAGVSNLSQNKLSAQAGALSGTQQAKDVAAMPIPKGESFAGSEVAQFVTPKQYGEITSLMRQGYLTSAGTSTTQSYSGFKGFFTGPTAYGQVPWYQRGSMNPFASKTGGRQTGGLIGSRLSDTIPGYMEGGLYNTPIVKRYGVGMQSGGSSAISNNNSNVVNTTNATNSFNFNTNVSRDGTIEVGSNSTSYAQQDVALSKNLNSKVYAVVLDAIKNEQRFGGSLAGTRQG